jgi:hypothetical protein
MPIRRSLREKSVSSWEVELKQMLSSNSRSEAVHRAAPSSGMVRCYIKRVKGFFGSHCTFQMLLDNGNVFLLAARRRKKSKASAYVISQDVEDLKRDSGSCIAKVRDGWAQAGSRTAFDVLSSRYILCKPFHSNPSAHSSQL